MPYQEKQSPLARVLAEKLVRDDIAPSDILIKLVSVDYDVKAYRQLLPYFLQVAPLDSEEYWTLLQQVRGEQPWGAIFIELTHVMRDSLTAVKSRGRN